MKDPNEIIDTYEAAFYLLHGATLKEAHIQLVPASLLKKYLFDKRWHIHMENISEGARNAWKGNYAIANVRDIAAARKKIKRFVKAYG